MYFSDIASRVVTMASFTIFLNLISTAIHASNWRSLKDFKFKMAILSYVPYPKGMTIATNGYLSPSLINLT